MTEPRRHQRRPVRSWPIVALCVCLFLVLALFAAALVIGWSSDATWSRALPLASVVLVGLAPWLASRGFDSWKTDPARCARYAYSTYACVAVGLGGPLVVVGRAVWRSDAAWTLVVPAVGVLAIIASLLRRRRRRRRAELLARGIERGDARVADVTRLPEPPRLRTARTTTGAVEAFVADTVWILASDAARNDPRGAADALSSGLDPFRRARLPLNEGSGIVEMPAERGLYRVLATSGPDERLERVVLEFQTPVADSSGGCTTVRTYGGVTVWTGRRWEIESIRSLQMATGHSMPGWQTFHRSRRRRRATSRGEP